jgi:hypothetical protein
MQHSLNSSIKLYMVPQKLYIYLVKLLISSALGYYIIIKITI